MTATLDQRTTPSSSVDGSLLAAAIRGEWIKLRSVRSTLWSLLATIAITDGFAALLCWARVHRFDRFDRADLLAFDPTLHSLRGIFLAQLAIGVLGVLFIGSEHTTGMIRTTFAATPQRSVVLAAKAIVLATVSLAVGAVSVFSAFFLGQAILSTKHIGASITDPHVLRALAGASLYFPFLVVLAFGIGAIVRRTSGAIAILFGLVLVLPALAQIALPDPWNHDVTKILPGQAGQAMFTVKPATDLLSPGVGALVFAAWVVAGLTIAVIVVNRRDA